MSDLVYHHDNTGKAIEGSIDALVQGIMTGRQVRAVVHDEVGYIAYNDFSTVRVIQRGTQKSVIADLPIRPATDNFGSLFDNFGLSVATIDSTGKYTRLDDQNNGGTSPMHAQYEVRWFLDKA